MAYQINCTIEFVAQLGQHDADLIDQVVVVFLDAMRFDERVDPDDVDLQLFHEPAELGVEGSNDDTAGPGLQQFQPPWAAIIDPTPNVLRVDLVVQQGGTDAPPDLVQIVFETNDQNAAPNVHTLPRDPAVARCCGNVLGIADGGLPAPTLRNQSGDELAAERDPQ